MKSALLRPVALAVVAILVLAAGAYGQATSRAAATTRPQEFTFVALSDTHIAAPADLLRLRQLLYTLKQQGPDMVLILGDLTGHAPEYMAPIKEVIDQSGVEVHVLSGNHDDNYGHNQEWFQSVIGRTHYSFDHKGYHFVMNWSQNQQVEWIKKDLDSAGPTTPVIFCQHYPPLNATRQEPWLDIAKRSNISIILNGDTHEEIDAKVGSIRNLTFNHCILSTNWGKGGKYYVCRASKDGRVQIEGRLLDDLKLLSPADDTPTITLSAPAQGTVVTSKVAFTGTAADDKSVTKVQYRIDGGAWADASGTGKWRVELDTAKLADGHHMLDARSIDSAVQSSPALASVIFMVNNHPQQDPNILTFQQGAGGYSGCTDITVRRADEARSPDGTEGSLRDLENWLSAGPNGELSEFYIKFDLSTAKIPAGAKIKSVTLTLYANRQVNMITGREYEYQLAAVSEPWKPTMTFATRPKDAAKDGIKCKWPIPDPRLTILPPKPIVVDLSPLKDKIESWLRDPGANNGLVFSPIGRGYNLSMRSSRFELPTLRPKLQIELEGK